MNIIGFRICSAKKIQKFLLETIEYRDDPEWLVYSEIYERRVFGMCCYRNISWLDDSNEPIPYETLPKVETFKIVKDIDMKSIMASYQDLSFYDEGQTSYIRQDF